MNKFGVVVQLRFGGMRHIRVKPTGKLTLRKKHGERWMHPHIAEKALKLARSMGWQAYVVLFDENLVREDERNIVYRFVSSKFML